MISSNYCLKAHAGHACFLFLDSNYVSIPLMKIILFILVFITVVSTFSFAVEYPFSLGITFTWDFSVRGGFEYRFGRTFGIKTDAGISILLLQGRGGLVWDALGVFYLRESTKPLQLNILLGIPNGSLALDDQNIHMTSFGGTFMLRFSVDPAYSIGLRLGTAYPIFYKDGESRGPDRTLLLGMWPDFGVEITYAVVPKVKPKPKEK